MNSASIPNKRLSAQEIYAELAKDDGLPSLDPRISAVLSMVNAPLESDVATISDLIEGAPDLANTVLHNINSGEHDIAHPVHSIHEAVVLLGFSSLRNLLLFFITHSFLGDWEKSSIPENKKIVQEYFDHILVTGLAADSIARKLGEKDPFQLFTYAILHDIGKLAVLYRFPERARAIMKKLNGGIALLVAERMELDGLTHAEVGGFTCDHFHFAPEIGRIARFHHDSNAYQGKNRRMVEILHLADVIGAVPRDLATPLSQKGNPLDGDRLVIERLGLDAHWLLTLRDELPARRAKYKNRPSGL